MERDKNVGSALISHDLYNKLCLKNLSNFEGLYSNIDLTHALFIIHEFMKDKINSKIRR